MLKLIRYLKPYTGQILCAIALLSVQAACDLALPGYMSRIVNWGVMAGNTGYIRQAGGLMLAVTLLGTASSIVVGMLAALTAAGISRDLRGDVFKKARRFSSAEFDKIPVSSMITRTTNDITQVQMLVLMVIRIMFYAPIIGIGGAVKAFATSTAMSWIIGAAVTLLICMSIVLFAVAAPKFKAMQNFIDRLNHIIRENLEGVLVIRAFNTQKHEIARFAKVNRDFAAVSLFVNRAMSLMMPVMMLVMNITAIVIVWVSAGHISELRIGVGDMMANMQYAMQIIMSFLMLSMLFLMIPRAAISANRVAEVLAVEESIHDPAEPEHFPEPFVNDIVFEDVTFRYPGGENVLHNISFTAKAGQTTAIIGATGSGKSTIMNLIMRFYDITGGSLRIGGKDVRSVSLKELRGKIGFVPQRSVLFSGTVRSNLQYGDKNADEAALVNAAEVAQAAEFIAGMECGCESAIAQGGGNVSGGQKQRLSIARALVRNAPIYIFDDCFSSLDLKTDSKLRMSLKNHMVDSTILLVTQRVSTAKEAEQIIVLDRGRIVGVGTHRSLMNTSDAYKEIVRSQLGEGELL